MDWLELKKSGKSIFIHGDCMDYLPTMPDKFAELAIVDPPYGIAINRQMQHPNLNKNWKVHSFKAWDDEIPSDGYFIELRRVSINQIIWGGNYYGLPVCRGWIAWDKKQEFSTGEFELAWNSRDMPSKAFRMARCEAYVGEDKIHPTQKPVALYRWLLHNYANPGDLILDTHVGSASSLIACEQMGFQYVGIEKDKDYYDAACERMEKAREKMKQEEIFSRAEIEVKQESLFES